MGNPDAKPVIDALEAAGRNPDTLARTWFQRIENERRRLLADTTPLSASDDAVSTVGQVTRKASIPRHRATLLFELARAVPAKRCLEMGSAVGMSGAYLAGAMASTGGGLLRSMEGKSDRAAVATRVWRRLGFENAEVIVGPFKHTLDAVLEMGPYDLTFVDGHHKRDATLQYVDRIRAASRPGALLVLDDINWSLGMQQAWASIRAQLTGSTTVDLGRLGLILLGSSDAGMPAAEA
jgi:predicted O-methyltransferase YrrM